MKWIQEALGRSELSDAGNRLWDSIGSWLILGNSVVHLFNNRRARRTVEGRRILDRTQISRSSTWVAAKIMGNMVIRWPLLNNAHALYKSEITIHGRGEGRIHLAEGRRGVVHLI